MKPNVCTVVIDAARASNLSCYGHSRNTTPNIDAVAEEGTVFQRAVSPAATTMDSVSSFFSGLYPGEHRSGSSGLLSVDEPTLPELFKREGYQTGAVTTNPFLTPGFGFERGIDEFHSIEHRYDQGMNIREFFNKVRGRSAPEIYLRFLIEALDRNFLKHVGNALQFRFDLFTRDDQGGAQATDRAIQFASKQVDPWFLYLHYTETHMKDVKHLYKIPDDFRYQYASKREANSIETTSHTDQGISEEAQGIHERIYDGALNYTDFYIGTLVERLKRTGQWENTLFIVTADHGECLGEHGYVGHGAVYEPGVHVPLIVKTPRNMPEIEVDMRKRVNTLGLFNALARLIGSDQAHGSVQDIFTAPEDSVLVQDYSDAWDWSSYSVENSAGQHAHYLNEVKLIRRGTEYTLYDLQNDPDEQEPISPESDQMETHRRLLDQRIEEFPDHHRAADALEVNTGTAKRLEDLGYI